MKRMRRLCGGGGMDDSTPPMGIASKPTRPPKYMDPHLPPTQSQCPRGISSQMDQEVMEPERARERDRVRGGQVDLVPSLDVVFNWVTPTLPSPYFSQSETHSVFGLVGRSKE